MKKSKSNKLNNIFCLRDFSTCNSCFHGEDNILLHLGSVSVWHTYSVNRLGDHFCGRTLNQSRLLRPRSRSMRVDSRKCACGDKQLGRQELKSNRSSKVLIPSDHTLSGSS